MLDSSRFTKQKYGDEWKSKSGVILYPANYHSNVIFSLMKETLPEIPITVSDESHEPKISTHCSLSDSPRDEQDTLPLREALLKAPRALFVICELNDRAEKSYAEIAQFFPHDAKNIIINFRQLGDFLPYGSKKTKNYDFYRKTDIFASQRNRVKTKQAYDLFCDFHSKAVFTSVLKRYLLNSDAFIPASDPELQYFDDVYTSIENDVFVDCGAFTGDTLLQYLKMDSARSFKKYIAIEPDERNIKGLRETLETLPNNIQAKVTVLHSAVGSEDGTVYLNPEDMGSSSFVTLEERSDVRGGGGQNTMYSLGQPPERRKSGNAYKNGHPRLRSTRITRRIRINQQRPPRPCHFCLSSPVRPLRSTIIHKTHRSRLQICFARLHELGG